MLGNGQGMMQEAPVVSRSGDADTLPAMPTNSESAPVPVIDPDALRQLGGWLSQQFSQYKSDRRLAEVKWMQNMRQYLGVYDPDIEKELQPNRSRAYPKITRVKCISTLARVMNLMFPGNERNWELKASPNAEMSPEDAMQAVQEATQRYQQDGLQPPMDDEFLQHAMQEFAQRRAKQLTTVIDDQLQELGGDQTLDYIGLNRRVVMSGTTFGIGLLRGPFVRQVNTVRWVFDPMTGQPTPQQATVYKPQFEFLPVWDFYPDMSAKTLQSMDGYFIRLVMTKAQVRKLADRSDFFEKQVKNYLKNTPKGNYQPLQFETELRTMGVREMVNELRDGNKYEVIVWFGNVSGEKLKNCGVDVPDDKLADDLDAEIWMIDNTIIKVSLNQWKALGVDVRMIHPFVFDEDDTSPLGNGLPNVIRDSQMSICAAVRMLLDNASVVCGPNLELNLNLLVPGQDTSATYAYKMWYRDDDAATAGMQAVRNIQIDAHMDELLKVIELFLKIVDMETFIGPATGGDMAKTPSEPMRTAAGASMLRGDASLPFKDIIRNFDNFTQSVINSLVQFNKVFNPANVQAGDFNVIARGATSLIAKEVRGMQLDVLATSITPLEQPHVDDRKFVEARFAARDLVDVLCSPEEARRKQMASSQQQQQLTDMQMQTMQAEVKKILSDVFKNISQGQKNSAAADAQAINAVLALLEKGLGHVGGGQEDQASGASEASSSKSKSGGGKNASGASGA